MIRLRKANRRQSLRKTRKDCVALAVFLALLSARNPDFAQATGAAHVAELPNGVQLTSGSSLLDVQIPENQVVRVHAEPERKSTARTLVMDPNPKLRPPSSVSRSERDGVYTLTTPALAVRMTVAATTGIYPGPVRTYLLRIHTAARQLSLMGRTLPAAGSKPLSEEAGANWATGNDRFGPVTLLRVRAGTKQSSVITLR